MQKIKAAVCHEFGQPLAIEEVQLAPPGQGGVEVTLSAVAICHSDISYAEGAWGGQLPAVYGHEAAGTVSATGPGVTGFAPGDRVVVTLIRSCGTCAFCASGKPTLCGTPYNEADGPLQTAAGTPLVQGMACGAFAEKVVVDQRQIVKLPDTIPMEAAALLSCGVAINLAVLGGFKYANFFAESALALAGITHEPWGLILPLGISFFTFHQVFIHLLVNTLHFNRHYVSRLQNPFLLGIPIE